MIRTDGTVVRWTLKPFLDSWNDSSKIITSTNFRSHQSFICVSFTRKIPKYTNHKITKQLYISFMFISYTAILRFSNLSISEKNWKIPSKSSGIVFVFFFFFSPKYCKVKQTNKDKISLHVYFVRLEDAYWLIRVAVSNVRTAVTAFIQTRADMSLAKVIIWLWI